MINPRPTQNLVYMKLSVYILDRSLTVYRSLFLYVANILGVVQGREAEGKGKMKIVKAIRQMLV